MIFDKLGRSTAALIAVALLTAGMFYAAGQAYAAPLPPPSAVAASPALAETAPVELAHGCHRGVLRDNRGWHFHSRACVRRNTAHPGLYDYPSNRRYYRGPLCAYSCRIVGGVKICRSICR